MRRITMALSLGVLGVYMVGAGAVDAAPAELRVPDGSGITAAPLRTSGKAGELYPVEVYLSKIPDLGAYQVRIEVVGGTTGTLNVEEVKMDRTREDYVFGADEIIDASNKNLSRNTALVAAVKSSGGAEVDAPAYAGTFYFRASDDAKGTFKINVQVGPSSSMMTDSVAREISFTVGKAAAINVGITAKRPRSKR